jgi:hypothetical protein
MGFNIAEVPVSRCDRPLESTEGGERCDVDVVQRGKVFSIRSFNRKSAAGFRYFGRDDRI